VVKEGVAVYGAFGIGNFKTKLHKACVARLFTRNGHDWTNPYGQKIESIERTGICVSPS